MSEDNESEKNKTKKKRSLWSILSVASAASIALMVVLLLVIIIGIGQGVAPLGVTGMITSDDASQRALSLIENNLVPSGTQVTIDDIVEESGLYKINVTISLNGRTQQVTSYMTKDGKLFFPQGIDVQSLLLKKQQTQQQQTQAPKSDRPKAEAFVMSHCPYGLQFMKAFVPVIELLNKKADLKIGFVDYIMHGKDEFNDNNRIYCIQKETPDKLTNYLRCYVQQKDYETCLQEAGIDKATIDSCIQTIDKEYNLTQTFESSSSRFPQYPIEKDLNDKYGVKGSPTFVLNGQVVSVSRSPEAIKEAICNAFNNPPKECDTQLSTTSESPGFGAIGGGSGSGSSSGNCS